jgi:hypothetical protein
MSLPTIAYRPPVRLRVLSATVFMLPLLHTPTPVNSYSSQQGTGRTHALAMHLAIYQARDSGNTFDMIKVATDELINGAGHACRYL